MTLFISRTTILVKNTYMMLFIRKFYLYILLVACLPNCNAWGFTIDTEQKNAEHFKGCIPTQSIDLTNEPEEIISNNNNRQIIFLTKFE